MKKTKQYSFIDKTLRDVESIEALNSIMLEARDKKILKDLNLTKIENLGNMDFSGWTLINVVFSQFNPTSTKKKELFGLSFVGATLISVIFAQAHLRQCNFDTKDKKATNLHKRKIYGADTRENDDTKERTSLLKGVDFFFSDLEYCRFRNTKARLVDFRYSHVIDCTMSKFDCTFGDFYFCGFKGCTNFIDSHFAYCSFTCSTFEHDCIRMGNLDHIAQENSKVYHKMLINNRSWLKMNPCNSFSSMNEEANKDGCELSRKEERLKLLESNTNMIGEAMNVYKQLSGLYAGKGLNRDSNNAYRKSKLSEISFSRLHVVLSAQKHKWRDMLFYMWIFICAWTTRLFGFGYQWAATIIWFGIIVVGYGWIGMKIDGKDDTDVMFHSLNNSIGPDGDFAKIIHLPWASIESFMGILLIGFLGFIIANKIRNAS